MPVYMIPEAFVVVDEFPRTLNGKVDRCALPSPESPDRTKAVGPRDELETTLLRIWETVLPVRPIGVTDNLFDLGGHSLLAARLIAQMQSVTGKRIPLSAIFRAPTIEKLARLLTSDAASNPDLIGLSFGGGCFFENGVGMASGSATFQLLTFTTN